MKDLQARLEEGGYMTKEKNPVQTEKWSDETIIDLYWQRDEQAIKATEEKYGKYLYTIAYRIIHDSMDCEECLNDTYLGTWNSIPPSRPQIFQAFLSRIMRNIATDKFRKKHASSRIPSELSVSLDELDGCMGYSDSVENDYAVLELARLLNAYLRSLPGRREFIFICRYYYADRVTDIAQMLDVSPNTIYRELQAIRDGLKACLEKEGYQI